jgi:hypothetical protein
MVQRLINAKTDIHVANKVADNYCALVHFTSSTNAEPFLCVPVFMLPYREGILP